jgi:hypothetical protein
MFRYFTEDSFGTNQQKNPRLVLSGHAHNIIPKINSGVRTKITDVDKFNTCWQCSRLSVKWIKCGGRAYTTGDENGYWAVETTRHAHATNCLADQE